MTPTMTQKDLLTHVDHAFIPAREGEKRSPCPALNTLANHGYLPRSGKSISLFTLVHAVHTVYHISYFIALLLSLTGIFLCGNPLKLTLDLDQLAKRDRLEHDASLVHRNMTDEETTAPTRVDPALLREFLSRAEVLPTTAAETKIKGYTVENFARTRYEREVGLVRRLSKFHSQIGRGEAALTVLVMGEELGGKWMVVPVERIEAWYGEERLPEGWKRPKNLIGLVQVNQVAGQIGRLMDKMKVKDRVQLHGFSPPEVFHPVQPSRDSSEPM